MTQQQYIISRKLNILELGQGCKDREFFQLSADVEVESSSNYWKKYPLKTLALECHSNELPPNRLHSSALGS